MNSLAEDREEVPGTLRNWVARKRQEKHIAASEPTTWFADLVCGDDRAMLHLGRSPGDVLLTAEIHAKAMGGYWLSQGRWMIDNNAGVEGEHSTFLVVYPVHDPYAEEVN